MDLLLWFRNCCFLTEPAATAAAIGVLVCDVLLADLVLDIEPVCARLCACSEEFCRRQATAAEVLDGAVLASIIYQKLLHPCSAFCPRQEGCGVWVVQSEQVVLIAVELGRWVSNGEFEPGEASWAF